jgi:hypothetical protein
VAPDRVGQHQRAAQGAVGEHDTAAVVHGQHAVLHRREDRLGSRTVAGAIRELLLEALGGLIEDACQLAQLVLARHADPRVQVAGGELAGAGHDLGDRPRERRRERRRQHRRDQEREPRGRHHGATQRRHLLLDAGQRHGHARHADHPARAADRDGYVQQVLLHGDAVAHGRRLVGREGLAHLGPAAVVLQRGELGAGGRGVRQHPPVGGDDRDAGVHVVRGGVHEPVEERAVRAAGQRLLHHARHQPGLGQQAVAGLVEGAPAQSRADQDEDHDERRRRRGDRSERDARAQAAGHSGSWARR